MLVNYQGDTLLVEGETAYSVSEVRSRHKELEDKILQCELDVQTENTYLQEHTKLRDQAIKNHESYSEELKGLDFILEKIRKAEKGLELSKVAEPLTDTKLEVKESTPAVMAVDHSQVGVGAEALKKSGVFGRRKI